MLQVVGSIEGKRAAGASSDCSAVYYALAQGSIVSSGCSQNGRSTLLCPASPFVQKAACRSLAPLRSAPSNPIMSLSTASFPNPQPIYLLDRLYRIAYGLSILAWQDLWLWDRRSRSRNPHADVTGPFYLPYAPKRNVADGKGIISSLDTLRGKYRSLGGVLFDIDRAFAEQPVVYLLYGQVKDASGNPIQAELDLWQVRISL